MTVERYLRLIAGAFVLLSLALGYWVSPYWYLVHGLRRLEPVPVGLYELVSYDGDSSQSGRKDIILGHAGKQRRRKNADGCSLRRASAIGRGRQWETDPLASSPAASFVTEACARRRKRWNLTSQMQKEECTQDREYEAIHAFESARFRVNRDPRSQVGKRNGTECKKTGHRP